MSDSDVRQTSRNKHVSETNTFCTVTRMIQPISEQEAHVCGARVTQGNASEAHISQAKVFFVLDEAG